MAADPDPRHGIVIQDADGPVSKRYSDRPDVFRPVDALGQTKGARQLYLRNRG